MSIEKIKSLEDLKSIVDKLKDEKKKIVSTNGVFDILHLGHIRYLKDAKKLGDVLIVGINADSSVKKLKGQNRPLNCELDRAETIAALECVDYVVIFDTDDPISILEVIRPKIHVKGGDYVFNRIVEKDVVEKYGGKVKLIPETVGYSTSKLIDKIVEVYR